MNFIIKTTSSELQRARGWWRELELQWKMAYNEVVFESGPTAEPPHDDQLMLLLLNIDTLRFAGPLAMHPNVTTPLTNLSGLIPLYHLRFLSVSDMALSGVTELVRHTELRHLFLHNNRITSLKGIEGATHLESLFVQHNRLTSLAPVAGLTRLHTLYATHNHLTSLAGLTEGHADRLRHFHILPNDHLPHREIIRLQNGAGILCRTG
ncbi:leucine-rich repeat domain-containing protein [Neolewinella litorea]|uniref:Leucine-rich repeat domain-containing protein n=1 Tax=Neolewinella litorea TaxID=2562452 RepID=A0A4S4N8E8_9BACT|nr:leucine-rich repeat domain-containing protein [Neolewinella litorea]THH35484.1 hypothetical protein E4021_16300 [Neolewinella litorea]